jgi:hypothetical protein
VGTKELEPLLEAGLSALPLPIGLRPQVQLHPVPLAAPPWIWAWDLGDLDLMALLVAVPQERVGPDSPPTSGNRLRQAMVGSCAQMAH